METRDRTDLQAVMDTLQETYGDASRGVLDQRAASAILRTLRARGWATLQEVGAIIGSTPDRAVVIDDRAMNTMWTVYREDGLGGPRFTARPARLARGGQ